MNIAELIHRSVRRNPHHIAMTTGEASRSYGELWDETARFAALMARSGVRPGDRVLVYSENRPEIFSIYLAAARLGAIFAPVHSTFKTMELGYVLKNSQAQILFIEEGLAEQLDQGPSFQDLLPESVVILPPTGTTCQIIDECGPEVGIAQVDADAPALICYTSGSSSATPTPVTRSHDAECWNAVTYADVWDINSWDSVLISLPLSWVYGLSTVGLTALSMGATIVLQPAHGSEPLLPMIEKERVTVFAGTMTMYSRLLAELQECMHDHSSLRRLYIGGEPVVLPVVRLVEHYTGIRPLQAYATTEVAPVLAVDPVRDVAPPEGTAGRLVEGSEIRLVDAEGQDVPDGQVGEAWLRGNGAMLAYWNEPALTASRRTTDGWYRSGDFMWRNPDGYYFLAGRDEDVVIRAGAKVAVIEVEAAIADVDGVDDVVVVAVPDEEFGEAVIAFVVLAPGRSVSVDTIYDDLGKRIARFKLPREICILKEFPLGFTGKRDRRHLRRLAQSQQTPDGVVVTMADWLAKRSRGTGPRHLP
ncbi:class I adenylate-forming enzyme family protein (plasmid) [Rhodococcus opacus]|uniref:class I adenylate-forming enzyme family protein n=1 Tax=Rhodococcus opacus TaxID=37919 RepID=UPI0034D2E16D